jgi:AraC-like DNA-binding protein
MHRHAHGLVPNKVIEVNSGLVASFLGRIYDPEKVEPTSDGLKVFHDPSYRTILLTRIKHPELLEHQLGSDNAAVLLSSYSDAVRGAINDHGGREVEHKGRGHMGSFVSAGQALDAAVKIRSALQDPRFEVLDLRLALEGGEPVGQSNQLFGDTIKFATYLCRVAKGAVIGMASSVREMATKDLLRHRPGIFLSLSPQDEDLLRQLFGELEARWTDADFDLDEYCKSTALSRSRLYRKCIQLTGVAPNQLLKDFRLEKALDLLREQRQSIAQVTFETGFTSPSYFTKCFKEKYGLLPLAYSKLP